MFDAAWKRDVAKMSLRCHSARRDHWIGSVSGAVLSRGTQRELRQCCSVSLCVFQTKRGRAEVAVVWIVLYSRNVTPGQSQRSWTCRLCLACWTDVNRYHHVVDLFIFFFLIPGQRLCAPPHFFFVFLQMSTTQRQVFMESLGRLELNPSSVDLGVSLTPRISGASPTIEKCIQRSLGPQGQAPHLNGCVPLTHQVAGHKYGVDKVGELTAPVILHFPPLKFC